jgi:site-specific recombinase
MQDASAPSVHSGESVLRPPPDPTVSNSSATRSAVTALLGKRIETRDGKRLLAAFDELYGASTIDERVDALHDLLSWTRRSQRIPEWNGPRDIPEDFRRFALVLAIFEHVAQARVALSLAVNELLADASTTNLIGSAGLPSGRGFLAEATDRIIARVLPLPRDDHDLGSICMRLFRHSVEVKRIGRMPLGLFARMVDLVTPVERPDLVAAMHADFADGLRLLGARVRSLGLYDKVRERSAPCRVHESPFFMLSACTDELAAHWARGEASGKRGEECRELIHRCREQIDEVSRRIEASGVSVDIVYCTDVIERCLTRISQMIGLLETRDPDVFVMRLHDFFSRLITAAHNDRSLRHLLRSTTGLLGRKVVERNGRSGEHYVAHTASEYRHIWVAAAGGGIVAGFMGAMKFPVIEAAYAPFVEGLLLTTIYIGGFLIMQALGLILATKQPAMFGATIADIVRTHDHSESVDALAILATRILRSQLAATISNLVMVSLTAFAVAGVWSSMYGEPYLSTEEALHTYESLEPLHSGTIIYATLTGVLLWLASMAGGLLDNWSVYHRIPQGIADHALGRLIGWNRMARLAGMWSRRVADVGTNVTLGVLLGMTPILGQFFGVPLDVRHVTLSTGKFMLGAASLGDAWYYDGLIWRALAGVGVMFILNLSVGFLLSLYVALRAYGLPRRRMFTVLAQFVRRVRQEPLVERGDSRSESR